MTNWASFAFADGLSSPVRSLEFLHAGVDPLAVRSLTPISVSVSVSVSFTGRCRGLGKAAPFLSMRHCFSSHPQAVAAAELVDDERATPPSSSPLPSPCLMLHRPKISSESESTDGDDEEDYYHFFSLAEEQKEFRIRKNMRLPWQRELLMPDDAVCVGSSHGWLACIHPRNCYPFLFNPFIESSDMPSIPLPAIETLPVPGMRGVLVHKLDRFSRCPSSDKHFIFDFDTTVAYNLFPEHVKRFLIQKLVLSSASSSTSSSSTVMAIHSDFGKIAFCKPWDERWTALQGSLPRYDDIVYFSKEGRFYAWFKDWDHTDPIPTTTLEAWDLSSDPPKSSVIRPLLCPRKPERYDRYVWNCFSYLVDSSGDLLLVLRYQTRYDVGHHRDFTRNNDESRPEEIETERLDSEHMCRQIFSRTRRIEVYQLDLAHNKWESVECLGERALFVGSNYSFSLSTRDYPHLRNNSVYFTDDYNTPRIIHPSNRGFDQGIFNLEDNCNTPYHPGTWFRSQPNPVWLVPNTHL